MKPEAGTEHQILHLWVKHAGDVPSSALNQEARQATPRAPCFTCSLNLGQAVVLVPLCCTVRHVNPLGCCLPTAQLVSNIITEDGNENSKLAFTFCMLNSLLAFLLKKPHTLSH